MDNKFRIEESLRGDSDRPKLEEIYMTSFPADERREWALVERLADDPSSPMTMLKITDGGGRAAGLLTIWRFDGLSYIEHFAVDSSRRGSGLGSKVLSRVVKAEMPVPIHGVRGFRLCSAAIRSGIEGGGSDAYGYAR